MEKQEQLWKLCQKFIREQSIKNYADTMHDDVYVNAPEFIEAICEIVGYYKDVD